MLEGGALKLMRTRNTLQKSAGVISACWCSQGLKEEAQHIPHLSQVKTTSFVLLAPGSEPPSTEGKRSVFVSGFLRSQKGSAAYLFLDSRNRRGETQCFLVSVFLQVQRLLTPGLPLQDMAFQAVYSLSEAQAKQPSYAGTAHNFFLIFPFLVRGTERAKNHG
eukprot:scaffold223116_cov18-Tisochrysis_lutea.AAC.1